MNLHVIPLTKLKGVTAKKAELLETLGLRSVYDLLHYFPFRHEDQTVRPLLFVADGEKITLLCTVAAAPEVRYLNGGRQLLKCRLETEGAQIYGVWFNRSYLKDHLSLGRTVRVTGKWEAKYRQITVAEQQFVQADVTAVESAGGLTPVYSVNQAVSQKWLRELIAEAVDQYADSLEDPFPHEWRTTRDWPALSEAVRQMHQPLDGTSLQKARTRLIYNEFLLHQLKLQMYRALHQRKADGIAHEFQGGDLRQFMEQLPFPLTAAQHRVLREIMTDLRQPYSMNRLLQGDVGAGKTVVAAFSMFAVYLAGAQSALMVPTEILAEQHLRSLRKLFAGYPISVELLTGSVSDKQRKSILAGLQMGMVHMLVGTHALIQDDVFFQRLGLIVTDEQHRFGVNQRAVLRRKGLNPDVLSMTATPIPRTLAITAYGDLDVSVLDELPKGRIPIITDWIKHAQFDALKQKLLAEIRSGRQAYLICPLIEESDKLDVQNAVEMFESLCKEWPDVAVGLLHGKLNSTEKDAVMHEFKEGRTQMLVSTTVVEVGVDVPNATWMVIYDAERFGLSQLHQLRGRVGRGIHQSYCTLVADPSSDFGVQRMKIMCETQDGFEISRRDLELRGAGDFFGTKQSGLPEFRLGDLLEDFAIMEMARDDVAALISDEHEQFWTSHRYLELRQMASLQENPLD